MSYTVVRVVDAGVWLFEQHAQRMARAGSAAAGAFSTFASSASPGIYALTWTDAEGLVVVQRPSSRYFDGMPVRLAVSPASESEQKTAPPNRYSDLRVPGVAVLLTSPDGSEIYESCSASVIAWDGDRIVVPPRDRPRTISTSELALRGALEVRERPLRVASEWPLAAINAVTGLCLLEIPQRRPFPDDEARRIRAVFEASARRPGSS